MEFFPGFDPASWEWTFSWWTVLSWAGKLLGIAFIPSVLLQRGTRPVAALTWILCLLTLPFLGVFLWWGMGHNYVKRRKKRRSRSQAHLHKSFHALAARGNVPEGHWAEMDKMPSGRDALIRRENLALHDEHGIFPFTHENGVTIYQNAETAYDAFEEAIRAARHHVHIQFYIWRSDATGRRFRDLLVEKARQGVEVRVLYDAVGGSSVDGDFMGKIRRAGGKTASFLPVQIFTRRFQLNFRNHRKILVIDGEVAFTGGLNLADEYEEWSDLACRLDGPVVIQFQEVFAEDWYFATKEDLVEERYFRALPEKPLYKELVEDGLPKGEQAKDEQAEPAQIAREGAALAEEAARGALQKRGGPDWLALARREALAKRYVVRARVVASGPDDPLAVIQKMFFKAITSAKERLYIMTPYFVPDDALMTALQMAAMRGVDVRLVIPAKSDVPLTQYAGRSYLEALLMVGVRVFEYEYRILHAKMLLMDQKVTILGSANMDIRSFRFNFEANVVLESEEVNRVMTQLYSDAMLRSLELRLDVFRQRSRGERLLEGAARLFSPLL